ncbi:hypothetical protein V2G26_011855 [Clonostachys chloroleuca]
MVSHCRKRLYQPPPYTTRISLVQSALFRPVALRVVRNLDHQERQVQAHAAKVQLSPSSQHISDISAIIRIDSTHTVEVRPIEVISHRKQTGLPEAGSFSSNACCHQPCQSSRPRTT